jgi:hypothetical protein
MIEMRISFLFITFVDLRVLGDLCGE